jgi:hypothetical protein
MHRLNEPHEGEQGCAPTSKQECETYVIRRGPLPGGENHALCRYGERGVEQYSESGIVVCKSDHVTENEGHECSDQSPSALRPGPVGDNSHKQEYLCGG